MEIRALKTIYGEFGLMRRGSTAEVNEFTAKELIGLGYAARVVPLESCAAAPQNALLTEDESKKDPFVTRPDGGRTGEEKPQSSSQAGRAHQKRQSTSRKGAAK